MALAAAAVQYKKRNGMLTLSASVLTFVPQSSMDEGVSLPIAQIKLATDDRSQAQNVITAESKKVLLQITASTAAKFNFQFVGSADPVSDRAGAEAAHGKRTRFAEALARLLAKPSANQSQPDAQQSQGPFLSKYDIELRQNLLSKNKDLKLLHQDLVISGILSEQEFWASRKEMLVNQDWIQGGQKRGLSSAALVDIVKATAVAGSGSGSGIKGETDSATPDPSSTKKFKFTPEIIHSIFVQFPAVQLAYENNVPEKMSEKQFWTKYAQSKSFHALTSGRHDGVLGKFAGGNDRDEKLFATFEGDVDDDSLPIPKKLKKDPINMLLDLSSSVEDHIVGTFRIRFQ
ncbi:hypothetical protein BC830DRAFT_1183896 [Chytriomyces sp. MP71]|nr:hypothetical protein BC830DRAFT_1183896 [Chytriomyces sp. MP71]